MRILLATLLLTTVACSPSVNHNGANATQLSISNQTPADTTVYVSFGADSKITAASWSFCAGNGLVCNFPLPASTTKPMTNPKGDYINATLAFGAPVGCGATKAELNINNPKWYDTLDVSLVDGYSNKIRIAIATTEPTVTLGPPVGKTGNEEVLGIFPYGCDICTERQDPPCGITKGKDGCKAGTQYDPKPPCQWQGAEKGGGDATVTVSLVP